jgi:AraC-like DNA-binding protein
MYNGNIINIIILAAGLLQGILISIVLLSRKKVKKHAGYLLCFFIFIITIQILFKLINKNLLLESLDTFYYISYFLPYLYGPLTYLYIKKSLSGKSFLEPRDFWHFTPFCISVLIILTSHFELFNLFQYINNDFYNITDTFIQLVLLTAYIYFSKKELKKIYESKRENIMGFSIVYKWFSNFANLVWFNGTIVIIALTLFFYELYVPDIKYAFLTLPLFLYWISYKALTQPAIFINSSMKEDINEHTNGNGEKYKKTGLSQHESEAILLKINNYLKQNEPYLDLDISLEKFSASLKVPKHHVSQVINQKLSKSFNDLINEKRVQKAQILLKDASNDNYTIASIAFESGFNSISNFNDVFKKYTGTTPTKYRNYKIN